MNNSKDIIIPRNSQGELMMENLPNDLWNEIHDKYFKDKINQLVKQKTRNIESPYFFFTSAPNTRLIIKRAILQKKNNKNKKIILHYLFKMS